MSNQKSNNTFALKQAGVMLGWKKKSQLNHLLLGFSFDIAGFANKVSYFTEKVDFWKKDKKEITSVAH